VQILRSGDGLHADEESRCVCRVGGHAKYDRDVGPLHVGAGLTNRGEMARAWRDGASDRKQGQGFGYEKLFMTRKGPAGRIGGESEYNLSPVMRKCGDGSGIRRTETTCTRS